MIKQLHNSTKKKLPPLSFLFGGELIYSLQNTIYVNIVIFSITQWAMPGHLKTRLIKDTRASAPHEIICLSYYEDYRANAPNFLNILPVQQINE